MVRFLKRISDAWSCATETTGTTGIDTGGTGLTKSGSTLSVDASQTQITAVGTLATGTWQATAIQDNYISSQATWHGKIDTAGTGLTKSGTTLSIKTCSNGEILKRISDAWSCATETTGTTGIDTGGTGLTKSGSTLSVDASQTQITLLVLLVQVHGKELALQMITFVIQLHG